MSPLTLKVLNGTTPGYPMNRLVPLGQGRPTPADPVFQRIPSVGILSLEHPVLGGGWLCSAGWPGDRVGGGVFHPGGGC